MTEETQEPRTFTFAHPGDIDAEPEAVGGIAAGQAVEAAEAFAALVEATVRQVRSSYLSRRLTAERNANPHDLAAGWEASDEARLCALLMRNATGAIRASRGLAERHEAV